MRLGFLFHIMIFVTFGNPALAQTFVGSAHVVDGDTLNMGETRFRLFGIDAVEAQQKCSRGGEEWACGQDASAALRGIVEGKSLDCHQRDIDPYGRIVAVCTVNGYDLSEQMARMGYAVALEDFSTDYVAAQEAAKSLSVGIWGGEFELPSHFREGDGATKAADNALLAERQRRERANQHIERAASSGASFRNCKEARAAGAAPLYRGQPGYGTHMDGDGDGVACEPYRGR